MAKVVFVGAGSAVFTRQLLSDIAAYEDLPQLSITLYDIDPERVEVALGTASQIAERFDRSWTVTATTDRREALAGADFVVNMIQVGGIEATKVDLEVPARYGLLQTIGDTTGAGGIFRALRTFPVLTQLSRDMVELCPEALFLNYTNPMAMNVWWMSVVAPSIRTVGLCHSVYWTARELCELIDVPFEETQYSAAGVNHQAWLTEWTHNGDDLYEVLRGRIAADPELRRRVRVEIFNRVGYYPTETSEHSAEYLSWFMRSPEQVERFRLKPLEYLEISERNVTKYEEAKASLATGKLLELRSGAAEYAPQIIHSVLTDTAREIHANVVNRGFIDNLPDGAVVEVPARVDATGITPHVFGSIPPVGAALNRTYLSVAELTIRAASTGSPELIRQALLVDPNASSSLTPDQIWSLCDELTSAHAHLLPAALGGTLPDM